MYGKNLFQQETIAEVTARIAVLTPESEHVWGKMNVAQMLAHCAEVFEMTNGHKKVKRSLLSYALGPLFKFVYTNEKPLGKGAPTSKEFAMVSAKDFATEQEHLQKLIAEFIVLGPEKITKDPHPFFGKLTPAEWARGMYKHLDHHLRQFGVWLERMEFWSLFWNYSRLKSRVVFR